MTNYLPINSPGTARRRVKSAMLINQYGSMPYVQWHEEDQILLADGSYRYIPVGNLDVITTMSDLANPFPLINLDTGEQYGTMTGAELLNALNSKYVFDARKRDDEGR